MKKLLLTGIILLGLASCSAHAQQPIDYYLQQQMWQAQQQSNYAMQHMMQQQQYSQQVMQQVALARQRGDYRTASLLILQFYVNNYRRANNDYQTPDAVLYRYYSEYLSNPNSSQRQLNQEEYDMYKRLSEELRRMSEQSSQRSADVIGN